MAEVFMPLLEENLFDSGHPLLPHILYCFRYVDDVICLWAGPEPLLHDFLDLINSLFPSINFTPEIGGQSLNFLDLTISIHENRHSFSIFRKPTATDQTIHNPSFHNPADKRAAFSSLIHGLLSVPLSASAFLEEVNIIKRLAFVNGIKIDVDQLIRKKIDASVIDSTTTHRRTDKPKRRVSIPFLGKISIEISRIFDLLFTPLIIFAPTFLS